MALGIINIICIGIGVVTLGYSLVKATHERKYWRRKEGYTLHVTLDVVLYFLTGAFIVVYNLYHILCDYMDDEKQLYQIEQKQQQQQQVNQERALGATIELKRSTPTPMSDNNQNSNCINTTSPESNC